MYPRWGIITAHLTDRSIPILTNISRSLTNYGRMRPILCSFFISVYKSWSIDGTNALRIMWLPRITRLSGDLNRLISTHIQHRRGSFKKGHALKYLLKYLIRCQASEWSQKSSVRTWSNKYASLKIQTPYLLVVHTRATKGTKNTPKKSPGKPPLASTSFLSSRMWIGRPPSSALFSRSMAASAVAGSAYVTNLPRHEQQQRRVSPSSTAKQWFGDEARHKHKIAANVL